MASSLRNTVAFCFLAGAAVASLRAIDLDLARMTPVPADAPIPTQDFFRLPLMWSPSINDAGTHLAALVSLGEKQALVAIDLAKGTSELAQGVASFDIYSYHWVTDKRLIFSVSTEKRYGLGLLATELGNFGRPYPIVQYMNARLIAVPRTDRAYPLYWLSRDALEEGADVGPVLLDTGGANGRFINLEAAGWDGGDFLHVRDNNERHIHRYLPALAPKTHNVTGYMADSEGKLNFGFTAENGHFYFHFLDGDKWQRSPISLNRNEIIASASARDEVLVLGDGEEGKPSPLQRINARTGEVLSVELQDKGYDFVGSVYHDRATGKVAGYHIDRSMPESVWTDPEYQAIQATLNAFFPKMVVRILDNDLKRNLFLVEVSSDRQPPLYHLVNLEKKGVSLVRNAQPWIDPQRMRPMSIVKYKTRDGKQLDAYLTLPAGASKQAPVALVVMPHGGPWVKDSWGFDGSAQFLANRGYAVLQPNYRGSPGFDWMFPASDLWDFDKMHDDVTDATKAILKTGLIDPKRIAIYGGSFGGYLTLTGLTKEPDLYRCGATFAGVFDWGQMIRNEKYYEFDRPWYSRMIRKLGDPKKQQEKFRRISPINFVESIKVPVLVAHGKEDETVDIAQSRDLISKLKEHGVKHETMIFSGEAHGLALMKNRVEFHERLLTFLEANLK